MADTIVFHTASLTGGGAERVFVLMANEFAARGHRVILFTWNAGGPNAGLLSPGVELIDLSLPIRGEGYGKLGTLRGLLRSVAVFRRLKPDAVYSAPEFANLLMALALVLARSRARFFPSFHAAASLPSGRIGARIAVLLSKLVAFRTTKAIAVSRGVGRDVVARGVLGAKVAVINNPLPVSTAAPQSAVTSLRQKVAAMGEGPVLVTAGRLVAIKDHRTLLAAFAKLRSRRPARLVICGEGPLRQSLEQYAAELGISGSVLFPGYITDPDACYAVADLFVLSSISEGFGNVLVEALGAGVPVVSTDAPHGPREILSDGEFGPLVPVGDVDALAKAIEITLDTSLPSETLKRRAADFAIGVIGDRYEALLA